MPEISQEELLKKYEELPEDLKTAMYSASTAEIIYEIGKKYGLNMEETGYLTVEVANIILGLNHPKNFISSLTDVPDIPKEKAVEIAQDINHQIFFPIREELKKLHGIGASSEITPSAPAEMPQKKLTPQPLEEQTPTEPRVKPKESIAPKTTPPAATDKPITPETALPTAKEETRAVPLKPEALSWIKPTTEEKREEIAPQKQVADDKYREPIE